MAAFYKDSDITIGVFLNMLILNTFIYFIRTNGFRNPEHEH